jgi:hypothetical protein
LVTVGDKKLLELKVFIINKMVGRGKREEAG